MPGLRPPPPEDHEGNSDFDVPFSFMTLQSHHDGSTFAVMSFDQIIGFMTGIIRQLDGDESAESVLKQMVRNLQHYKQRFQ